MQITFEGKTWEDIIIRVNRFAQEHGKIPVDLDNRHPHGNTPVPQTQPAETSEEPAPADDSEVTEKDVVMALRAHVKKHGKESAIAILAEFDVTRASDLKPADRLLAKEKLDG